MTAATFPTVLPRCTIWIELTNGHGETPTLFKLARITPDEIDGESMFEIGFTLNFTDPRDVHTHHLTLVGLLLPDQGEYRMTLEAFGLPLMERRFVAIRLDPIGAQES